MKSNNDIKNQNKHNSYHSYRQNKDDMTGHTAHMELTKFIGNFVRKNLLERPLCRWEDNIKVNLNGVGCEVVDQIQLARDRD